MIVIGIDPGLARVGFGVIKEERGRITALEYGCIETGCELRCSERLLEIYNALSELFGKYEADCIAVEKLFFSRNTTTALSVSEARGIILLAAEQKGIPITEFTPNQIKQAVTGSGRADKRQMQDMIKRLLGLDKIPRPDDAADGLSIALCHIHMVR
ncbi:crossover junction endodeoxyribonuclease RuvC [Methanoplanus endosymbiosus]|uniref:Crossover junction endodeoxyribonuclease RuvC n=1 Tax=Methanoplanus endosymbiosus TaxID=33865 RepID=A0A9E7PMM3_9EURY|nr:crossover junction endodeoxyribonuclease RuvC [Methanoplanus endosymbiosus]UUX91446.1 crossover junction endodeoxyribonuclease RuvC [Methanoplanus endosymbiosus]